MWFHLSEKFSEEIRKATVSNLIIDTKHTDLMHTLIGPHTTLPPNGQSVITCTQCDCAILEMWLAHS